MIMPLVFILCISMCKVRTSSIEQKKNMLHGKRDEAPVTSSAHLMHHGSTLNHPNRFCSQVTIIGSPAQILPNFSSSDIPHSCGNKALRQHSRHAAAFAGSFPPAHTHFILSPVSLSVPHLIFPTSFVPCLKLHHHILRRLCLLSMEV